MENSTSRLIVSWSQWKNLIYCNVVFVVCNRHMWQEWMSADFRMNGYIINFLENGIKMMEGKFYLAAKKIVKQISFIFYEAYIHD